MSRPIHVALDAMGGDHGAAVTVAGVARLSLEERPVRVFLVGDEAVLSEELSRHRYDPTWIQVVHAPGAPVRMDENPKVVLKERPDCSLNVACGLVRDGHADALVSAGSTGATILAASAHFSRLPGVRRAALASVYPTEQKHGPRNDPFALMLDVGATLNATAGDLVSFAVMGSAYANIISGTANPKVALLSNGTEPNKGTPEIVEAHQRLRGVSGLDFYGNVEGLDIPRGTVDVIVCSGFLGNVVIKMLEGVGEVASDLARGATKSRLVWKVGIAMLSGGLAELKSMTDWKQYGGAPLLGLDRVVIKAHGRSNDRAIRNAIKVAAKAVHGDLSGNIKRGMEAVAAAQETGGPSEEGAST